MIEVYTTPLLSICIPTYNRAVILEGSLKSLFDQVHQAGTLVELIVSDNCSEDDTERVVTSFIQAGMEITYYRNETNIGMEKNFIQCFRRAHGKYVLILGDDDYLLESKLQKILFHLQKKDYGLVHLEINRSQSDDTSEFHDNEEFLKKVSYWSTYISSNIVNSAYTKNFPFEDFLGTYLCITPLYINAAIKHGKNLLIHERVFEDGRARDMSGGYNFFNVFVNNYLYIWKDYLQNQEITLNCYRSIKFDLFSNFIAQKVYTLLIVRKKGRFDIQDGWKIVYSHYWYEIYFYLVLTKLILSRFIKKGARKIFRRT